MAQQVITPHPRHVNRMVPAGKIQSTFSKRLCLGLLILCIVLYVIAYSSKSIAAYSTGHTMFDLATFEQGFWNATKGTLFFYSLEGEMSRFGRHFSPIFLFFLPIYALHPDASTLLVLQSLALGLAAIPLYLIAAYRTGSSPVALILSVLYLTNPAVHDVNIVNEFHEIAFAVPLLFLAFYAAETKRWRFYLVSIIGVLMVKEELALTVFALGVYVFFRLQRRLGLVTVVLGITWFIITTQVLMPILRGPYGPVPFPGYDYLGQGVFGIATGIFTKLNVLISVITAQPKQDYLYWLFEPLAFTSFLAPEVLVIAFPALLEILASTYPPTYEIFERYVAPVIPFVFIAAAVGIGRICYRLDKIGFSRSIQGVVLIVFCLAMGGSTIYAQSKLYKYPMQLLSSQEPDPHSTTVMQFIQLIPEQASVVVEDHRWLARLSHRKYLYFLSGSSPEADYLLLDRKSTPITNVSLEEREAAIRRITRSKDYLKLRTEDGVSLYVRRSAYERDGDLFRPYTWDNDREDNFGSLIRLRGYSFDNPLPHSGEDLVVTLYWQALQEPITADYTVFVQVFDKQQHLVAQNDSLPQNAMATTLDWKQGETVRDPHLLTFSPGVAPGDYELRVGLYTLSNMKRLNILDAYGNALGDSIELPFTVN